MKEHIKKIKSSKLSDLNHLVIFLIAAVIVFCGYLCYDRVLSDTEAPVLSCKDDQLVVSVNATEKELLKGVTAEDNRDGDVTKSIVIEDISQFAGDERVITYAAIDGNGNVGRIQRTLKYTDYEAPTFKLSAPLRFSYNRNINVLEKIGAESTLDGDLTSNVKYSTDSIIDTDTPGFYKVEFRVSDSTGTVAYLPLEIEIYNPLEESIKVDLSDYLIYLEKGDYFDPNAYYEGADGGADLSISSDVDTSREGIYRADYTVTGDGKKGVSRLIVVVTD